MIVSPSGPNSSICFIPPYREAIPAANINNVGFMNLNLNAKLIRFMQGNKTRTLFEYDKG